MDVEYIDRDTNVVIIKNKPTPALPAGSTGGTEADQPGGADPDEVVEGEIVDDE